MTVRGEVFSNGEKSEPLPVNFLKESVVRLEVERRRGVVRWVINGVVEREIVNLKIRNVNVEFIGYIEMATPGDCV
jgi:hypothetical protein